MLAFEIETEGSDWCAKNGAPGPGVEELSQGGRVKLWGSCLRWWKLGAVWVEGKSGF